MFLYFHEVITELQRRHIPTDQTLKLYANLVFGPIRRLERENKLKMFDAASTSLVSFICKLLSVSVTLLKKTTAASVSISCSQSLHGRGCANECIKGPAVQAESAECR